MQRPPAGATARLWTGTVVRRPGVAAIDHKGFIATPFDDRFSEFS